MGVPLDEILKPGRPAAEALAAVLEEAARRYAADPNAAGCFTIEGPDARAAARALTSATEHTICRSVAAIHHDVAELTADYVVTVMTGLSAMAREGHGLDRLLGTASLAGTVFETALLR
jgi:TetR/AcrR family transcriptional repressor for divergent bdcA